ncbi:propionate CoA-transferase [Burkholderia sp. Ac-20345]|uniref:acyl CoA:acetate/3-ketoacid CoA transferase n=1 Tax=Burkholderia sp. Ac-20345 TaxID=2703891 RepID=UPI00197B4233|nr:CoA-transferase [Burkholderia sp. Ac-20345]MBN3781471.1 propionate CoA-transferase [Burkholderia sp. Ac-20345]
MTKICSAQEAVSKIPDGCEVASVGVIGWITPDRILRAIRERHDQVGSPANLSFYFPCGTGDSMGIKGMDWVAKPGLMKRIVSGSYVNPVDPRTGKRPELMRLIRENAIEAYSWPIGASMHWLREVARRGPGYLTRIGLGTYVDPRQHGGKLTGRSEEDLIRLVEFNGEEFLFYPTRKLDVGIIRASSADEFGNLSFESEALMSSSLAIALAVKACGGRVIAQVQRVTERRTRAVQDVKIPGVLVDHVVVDAEQLMVTDTPFDAAYLGGQPPAFNGLAPLPLSIDKIVARRAAREVPRETVSIFGFGASSDAPLTMWEDGLFEGDRINDYWMTTEHGTFGGLVMSGWQFSANLYPEALLDGLNQFDFINGGNCRFAALAFAQFDAAGNVNVSRFGAFNPGAGGFIDIAYNARDLIFTGTFTTAGLEAEIGAGGLSIAREGRVRKFVSQAEQITYPVMKNVRERGQTAKLITERAVFEVEPDGLVLTEVAKGIDVQRDVLEQMEFRPKRIAEKLKLMEAELFAN